MSRVLFLPALACRALLALTACSGGPSATSGAASASSASAHSTSEAASAEPAVLEELVDQVLAAVEEG